MAEGGDQNGREQRQKKPPAYLKDYEWAHDKQQVVDIFQQPPPLTRKPQNVQDDNVSVTSHQSGLSYASNASELRRRKRIAEFKMQQQLLEMEEEEEERKQAAEQRLAEKKLETEQRLAETEQRLAEKKLETEQRLAEKKLQNKKALLQLQLENEIEDMEDDLMSGEGDNFEIRYSQNPQPVDKTPHPVHTDSVHKWIHDVPDVVSPVPSNHGSGNSPLQRPRPTSPVLSVVSSKAKSEAVQMGEMFASAIEKLGEGLKDMRIKSSSGSTEKMLARQSHGKELPTFYGKPEQWLTFVSAYRRSTEICGFSEDENLLRLQKCLKGEARAAVESMLDAPGNVPAIMDHLEIRFGQKRHIIRSLISQVQKTPSVKENDLDSIIQFAQKVQNLVFTLKAMNSESHLTDPRLLDDLTEKLPPTMRMQWMERAESEESQTLVKFTQWINLKMKLACQLIPPKVSEEKKGKDKKCAILLAAEPTEDPKKGKKEKFCQFCQAAGHYIQQCPGFQKADLDERHAIVKDRKLCRSCLIFGHSIFNKRDKTKECRSKKKCTVAGCEDFHHPLLHNPRRQAPPPAENPEKDQDSEASAPPLGLVEQQLHVSNRVAYDVLPIILRGPKGDIHTHALLDSGSGYTLLDEEVAKKLHLNGTPAHLPYSVIGGKETSVSSMNVSLTIINPGNNKSFEVKNVMTYPSIGLRGGTVTQKQIKKWKHLQGLPLPTFTNVKPAIMIGKPHAALIIARRVVDGPWNAPIAAETLLGWTVSGKMEIPEEAERVHHMGGIHHVIPTEDDELHQKVKSFFTTEEFGVKLTNQSPFTKQEQRAEAIIKQTLRRDGDKYEVGLLWSEDKVVLPESRSQAEMRLKHIEKKLDQDPSYAEKYCANLQHYIDTGYLVRLTPQEEQKTTDRTWYLPHFAVTKPSKPGKLRLVFDAAAKSQGVSLNDKLLSGPDILKPLPSVLCKFRERKVAFSADIKEMFHQVRMRKDDQESQRLLWRGMDRSRPPDVYRMAVMTFGATCSPFCAQFVKKENALKFQDESPRAVDAIVNRHYVDDLLDSADSVDEADELFKDIFRIQKEGGFHICNWVSNEPKLIKRIPVDLRSNSQKTFQEKGTMSSEKVLGLVWNPAEDVFTFSTNFEKVPREVVMGERAPTKREALSLVMSVFDPMGFTAPLTVKAKILLQRAWRTGIHWDDPLPDSLQEKWKEWLIELQEITVMKIPRCYSNNFSKASQVELHVFCDASELAFAAVAYFRLKTGETAFVAAKTRVTPLKAMTIPRYELQASVMGVRLAQSILQWHSILPTSYYYWTDSKTVKCWLNMDTCCLKQFVAVRVGEVQESSDVKDWRWISTLENVADEATRDRDPCDFTPSSRWLNGPAFLRHPHDQWPIGDMKVQEPKEIGPDILEIKKEYVGLICHIKEPETLIEITRFSKWLRLIRTTATVLRYIRLCLKRKALPSRFLQVSELQEAEMAWQKWSQRDSFPEVIESLQQPNEDKRKKIQKKSKLRGLSIFLDPNGILRMKGRVTADVQIGNLDRNPVILDSKHPYTVLLLRHHHEKAGHHGKDRVTNEIMQRYCILGLREAVKRTWRNCQDCKNRCARPDPPEMAPLPKARLQSYQRPFTQTGVDYFGPMEVKVGYRRIEKRYGALFTCLVTRAVHIELAGALSTDSFIMALRRFIARRGNPRDIFSDNGTNFVGADNELRKAILELDQEKVSDELSTRMIDWHFNPPHAPHMGGSWERMVKSIKVALHATLKGRVLKEEILTTVMAEAENSVNGHPLTYVDADVESAEVLTPNHFLIGTGTNMQPPGEFTDRDLNPGKQWKLAERLSDHFWIRWTKEFLPTLSRRQKWIEQKKVIQVGDVVIMADDALHRNSWPKGTVTEVAPNKDGQVRWAMVKTPRGTYKRPTVKLCVLDVKR